MNIISGDTVFLVEAYNGYPVGTEMLFLYLSMDSGSSVPLCIVKDDNFHQQMHHFDISTEAQLMKLFERDARNSNVSFSLAETYFTTLKPWPYQISSMAQLDKQINEHQSSLEKLTGLISLITGKAEASHV